MVVRYPSCHNNKGVLCAFAATQTVLALFMISTGGYLAYHVHDFYTSFERFSAHDSIPYYSLMYYGSVAQAAYGCVLVFLTMAVIPLLGANIPETKQSRVEAVASEAAAPNTNEKEFSQV
jgi:hypothetical protein